MICTWYSFSVSPLSFSLVCPSFSLQALTNLTASSESEEQVRLARELASVVVQQADIDLLASEFEISAEEAEKKIRQARGDVKLAITNALDQ